MKLSLLACMVIGAAHGASGLSLAPVPEPSSGVMLILGVCAIGIGIVGRLRRRRSE